MAGAPNFAPQGNVPPPGNPPQPPNVLSPSKRPWYIDEIVVAAFAFLGVGCGVVLPLRYGFTTLPPVTVSILLATGLAALAYRYLGGIEGASFTVGALKLTGALAALIGIAWFINGKLTTQVQVVQVWDVYGKVVKENNIDTVNELVGADFTLFPADATPAPNGDFHLRFIFDPANPVYVTIKHNNYGPVIIPLEPEKLKEFDPGAKVSGKLINLGHPVVLHESQTPAGYTTKDAQPLKPVTPSSLSDYVAPTLPSRPAN